MNSIDDYLRQFSGESEDKAMSNYKQQYHEFIEKQRVCGDDISLTYHVWLECRIAEVEAERDILREQNAALREALRVIVNGQEWEWCNVHQLVVPSEYQVDRMTEFVAYRALAASEKPEVT